MFEFYNTVLRAKGQQVPWGDRYPCLAGNLTTDCFVTTIHAVNSGIIKLSALTPVVDVYRGAAGLKIPDQLEVATKFAGRLSIEYG
jgi:hypothetical protein